MLGLRAPWRRVARVLHAWLEGALEEGGQGVEVTGDRAKQRSRADLGLQAFEADVGANLYRPKFDDRPLGVRVRVGTCEAVPRMISSRIRPS
jgi:hypothetical protein